MPRDDKIELVGVVQDAMGGGHYKIEVDNGPENENTQVRAKLSGRLQRRHIKVLPGDTVTVGVSPYDLSHGLIIYRGQKTKKPEVD